MYSEFYGFSQEAFRSEPDAQFYFDSLTHRKAKSYLGYGLKQGEGFIVVTGEAGTGKTMLVRHLGEKLSSGRLLVAILKDDAVSAGSIFAAVAAAFELDSVGIGSKDGEIGEIEAFLHKKAREGRRVLLVVDECQRLSIDALEELRILTNLHLGAHPLMQTLLLGRPEFKRLLSRSEGLAQLRQRVIAAHNLEPMHISELEKYVDHRLTRAGWAGAPQFHKSLWADLHKRSAGNPSDINVHMSRLLEYGARHQLSTLRPDMLVDVPSSHTVQVNEPEEPIVLAENEGDEPVPERRKQSGAGLGDAQLQAIRQAFSERDRAFARLRNEVGKLKNEPSSDASVADPQAAVRLSEIEARLDEQDAALKQVMAAIVELLEDASGRRAA